MTGFDGEILALQALGIYTRAVMSRRVILQRLRYATQSPRGSQKNKDAYTDNIVP